MAGAFAFPEETVMPLIRSTLPGSSSYGTLWPEAGSVAEVSAQEAAELLRIEPGRFTEVLPDEAAVEPPAGNGDGESGTDRDEGEITEPAPEAKAAITEPAPRGRRGKTVSE